MDVLYSLITISEKKRHTPPWAVFCLVAQLCLILCNPMDCNQPGSSALGDSPGKNPGVGCLALPQGIFPTQESNSGLPHCGQIPYHLRHQRNPWILELVAYPFPRGSSQPRNWTEVSCIAGGFFTSWATRYKGTPNKTYLSTCICYSIAFVVIFLE